MRVAAFALFSFFAFVIPSIPVQARGPTDGTTVSTASQLVPPCEDSLQVPSQARVPCLGLAVLAAGTSVDVRANAVVRAGAGLRFNYHLVNAAAVFIRSAASLSALLADPNVLTIIPDRPIHAIEKPAAPGGKKGGGASAGESAQVLPSGVDSIGAAPGSSPYTGAAGIGVAIADTGIDFSHPDLNVASTCYDAFGGDCRDDHGHGTHVSGIVAALDNSIGVVGVAPGDTPYAVKVLDQNGSGSDSTVMAGLEWVADNAASLSPPIRVVNMSLGRSGSINDNPPLRDLIANLHDSGISVIVAAGNDPNSEVSQQVPATYPGAMAIASTSALGGKNSCKFYNGVVSAKTASYFTTDGKFDPSTGIGVTISAPGEKQEDISRGCFVQSTGILSLKLGGGTTRMSGTSMAAPHVAGVAALMQQQANSTLAPENIRQNIRASAQQLGRAPLDSPTSRYTFDGEREGVISACAVFGAC